MPARVGTAVLDPMGLAIGELLIRGVCAGLFLWAGWAKLRDPDFATAVARLLKLERGPSVLIARVVPPIELLVGLGLLLPPTIQLAAVVGIGLLAAFSAILAVRLASRSQDTCACFGSRDAEPITWLGLLRNAGMAATLIPAAFGPALIEARLLGAVPAEVHVVAIGTAAMVAVLGPVATDLRAAAKWDPETS
jgi:uncharacterized membrane protein YphA (DoxX/SURF4 family)